LVRLPPPFRSETAHLGRFPGSSLPLRRNRRGLSCERGRLGDTARSGHATDWCRKSRRDRGRIGDRPAPGTTVNRSPRPTRRWRKPRCHERLLPSRMYVGIVGVRTAVTPGAACGAVAELDPQLDRLARSRSHCRTAAAPPSRRHGRCVIRHDEFGIARDRARYGFVLLGDREVHVPSERIGQPARPDRPRP